MSIHDLTGKEKSSICAQLLNHYNYHMYLYMIVNDVLIFDLSIYQINRL